MDVAATSEITAAVDDVGDDKLQLLLFFNKCKEVDDKLLEFVLSTSN